MFDPAKADLLLLSSSSFFFLVKALQDIQYFRTLTGTSLSIDFLTKTIPVSFFLPLQCKRVAGNLDVADDAKRGMPIGRDRI